MYANVAQDFLRRGGASEEVAKIADRMYVAHGEHLPADATEWPEWTRPVLADARARYLAAAAARVAEEENAALAARARRLAELRAKFAPKSSAGGEGKAAAAHDAGGAEPVPVAPVDGPPSVALGAQLPSPPKKKRKREAATSGEPVAAAKTATTATGAAPEKPKKKPLPDWKELADGGKQSTADMVSRRCACCGRDRAHQFAQPAEVPVRAGSWGHPLSQVR